MLKKILCLFTILAFTSLTAIDSGTLSATLYYQLTQKNPDQEHVVSLFHSLVNELEEEQVSPCVIDEVVLNSARFLAGEDVVKEVKELWLQLTAIEDENEEDDEDQNVRVFHFDLVASSNEHKKNSLMSSKHYRKIKPWLIPNDHPMKKPLDTIFKASRAIQDEEAFLNAGFDTFAVQIRSYIRVARHSELPGYVVKVYLDNVLKLKKKIEGWVWLANRCEGSKRLDAIFKRKQIKLFKVAKKWIYVLPTHPKPLTGSLYNPKAEILIAEDMNIVSNSASIEAWRTAMTKAHLDELFVIIAFANGDSYRPDNITYSTDGKFAFIDTEYLDRIPNFITPQQYFSPEMAAYWQQLLQQGGP